MKKHNIFTVGVLLNLKKPIYLKRSVELTT